MNSVVDFSVGETCCDIMAQDMLSLFGSRVHAGMEYDFSACWGSNGLISWPPPPPRHPRLHKEDGGGRRCPCLEKDLHEFDLLDDFSSSTTVYSSLLCLLRLSLPTNPLPAYHGFGMMMASVTVTFRTWNDGCGSNA